MAITNAQILQWVYSKIGSERQSGVVEPLIIAVANLAYRDLAQFLVDNDQELAKKLMTTLTNQTWASSKIAAPTDMLFHKQRRTTRIDLGGTLIYQVEDRDKLDLVTGLGNSYYALEGKYFYIKHSAGTTGASNLNISYYKIPTKDDIDDDLRNIFLDLLLIRLIPQPKENGRQK